MLDNDSPSGSHLVDRDAAALMEDEAGGSSKRKVIFPKLHVLDKKICVLFGSQEIC